MTGLWSVAIGKSDLLWLAEKVGPQIKDALSCVDVLSVDASPNSLHPLPLYTYEWETLSHLVSGDSSAPETLSFALNTAVPADFVAQRNRHWMASHNNRVLTQTVDPFETRLSQSIREETAANMQEFLGIDPETP
jgi:hypothetical protein